MVLYVGGGPAQQYGHIIDNLDDIDACSVDC